MENIQRFLLCCISPFLCERKGIYSDGLRMAYLNNLSSGEETLLVLAAPGMGGKGSAHVKMRM